ncbi:MAG: 23S rRNA (adenine(2503)-C(2))-methyltransferase RlmN [Pseudomonadota bacterium]|nr:23S rRNA (adenine(2503)-C(2))-methyltransferase RlmN [Pseudomonadota bacterium]
MDDLQKYKKVNHDKDMAKKDKIHLLGISQEELAQTLKELGIQNKTVGMRVKQLWSWIFTQGKINFEEMTNLSKEFRLFLKENYSLERPKILAKQVSVDGTRKYLFSTTKMGEFETVFIPEDDRGTVCLSSQIGCTLNCSFCHTGTQKLVRNLEPFEIVGQVLAVKDDLLDWSKTNKNNGKRLVSNIVIMGMGEPLYNFENVKNGIDIIMNSGGLAISRKRITLSTSGVIPNIHRVANEIGCLLAVSLHATTDAVRNRLVPINKKWNIEELMFNLKNYPKLSNSERITFEYVMLRNVNDSLEDAKRLAKLIKGIPAKINLIPFNPWPGSYFIASYPEEIEKFSTILRKAGYSSPVRKPRGQDILAACGQLKSNSLKQKKINPIDQTQTTQIGG